VNADAGYTEIENREEIKKDEHLSKAEYRVPEVKSGEQSGTYLLYSV
jgi:hypothetical protein